MKPKQGRSNVQNIQHHDPTAAPVDFWDTFSVDPSPAIATGGRLSPRYSAPFSSSGRTGILPVKQQLQQWIDQATLDQPVLPELVRRLQKQGIEVQLPQTRTGKVKGISYSVETDKGRVAIAGSAVGSHYSLPGLQKHLGISYDPQRDNLTLESQLRNRNPIQESSSLPVHRTTIESVSPTPPTHEYRNGSNTSSSPSQDQDMPSLELSSSDQSRMQSPIKELAELKQAHARLWQEVGALQNQTKTSQEQTQKDINTWTQTNLSLTQLLTRQTELMNQIVRDLQQSEQHRSSTNAALTTLSGQLEGGSTNSPSGTSTSEIVALTQITGNQAAQLTNQSAGPATDQPQLNHPAPKAAQQDSLSLQTPARRGNRHSPRDTGRSVSDGDIGRDDRTSGESVPFLEENTNARPDERQDQQSRNSAEKAQLSTGDPAQSQGAQPQAPSPEDRSLENVPQQEASTVRNLAAFLVHEKLIQHAGKPRRNGVRECEGKYYLTRKVGDKLTVTAKDGRGEILSCRGEQITGNLTHEDIRRFHALDQKLEQFLAQQQQQAETQPRRPQQDRGISL